MNRDFPFLSDAEQREIALEAWVACRKDELFTTPRRLARSLNDFSVRGTEGPLEDLLAALLKSEPGLTVSERANENFNAAMDVIEKLVREALDSEERCQEHETFIESMVEQHGHV